MAKESIDDLTATMMAKDVVKRIFELLERHGYLAHSSMMVVKMVVKEMQLDPDLFIVSDLGHPANKHEAKMNFLKAFKVYWNKFGGDELRDATECLYNTAYYGETEIFGPSDHCPFCDFAGIDYVGIEELSGMEVYFCNECASYWRVDDERAN